MELLQDLLTSAAIRGPDLTKRKDGLKCAASISGEVTHIQGKRGFRRGIPPLRLPTLSCSSSRQRTAALAVLPETTNPSAVEIQTSQVLSLPPLRTQRETVPFSPTPQCSFAAALQTIHCPEPPIAKQSICATATSTPAATSWQAAPAALHGGCQPGSTRDKTGRGQLHHHN